MAENNPAGLTDRDSAAHTRVEREENPSVVRIEILRLTAERNRPDDLVKRIAAAAARALRPLARANRAMPSRRLQGPRARQAATALSFLRSRCKCAGHSPRSRTQAVPRRSNQPRVAVSSRPSALDQMALCRRADRALQITRGFSMDRFAARPRALPRHWTKPPRVWQGRHWISML